jgi:hypothetical protein
MGKKIKLHHKEAEGLVFGPESEIKFGIRGGFEPGFTVVDEDDPLLPLLLATEDVEVVNEAGPARVYVSPLDPDKEFKSKAALMSHIRSAAKAGDPTAVAWLERNAEKHDTVDAEE